LVERDLTVSGLKVLPLTHICVLDTRPRTLCNVLQVYVHKDGVKYTLLYMYLYKV